MGWLRDAPIHIAMGLARKAPASLPIHRPKALQGVYLLDNPFKLCRFSQPAKGIWICGHKPADGVLGFPYAWRPSSAPITSHAKSLSAGST